MHENVGWFDVSVADVQRVAVGQSPEYLVNIYLRVELGQTLGLANQFVEVLFVVLHHHV